MTTILPQLEQDLLRAAQHRLRANEPAGGLRAASVSSHPAGRWGSRRLTRALPVAAVALVALLVAGGAVALLARSSAPPAGTASLAGSRHALIRSLELLRRSQTQDAQRGRLATWLALGIPRPWSAGSGMRSMWTAAGSPTLDRPLVRVVVLRATHTRVIVAPVRYRARRATGRFEGIVLTLNDPRGALNSTGPDVESVASFRVRGLTLLPALESGAMPGAALVPNGVARVRIGAARLGSGGAPAGTTIRQLRPILGATATSVAVHGNLAIIRYAHPPSIHLSNTTASGLGFDVRIPETWYSPSGAVLRRFTVNSSITVHAVDVFPHRHFPVNSHGESYGTAGASPTTDPDLIWVVGRRANGSQVGGYVRRAQLDAATCAEDGKPPKALHCSPADRHHSHTMPVYARNGTTLLGTFTLG